MPAEVGIDPESGTQHQNVRPRLAANRLGRVAQRVVTRQEAVADDFQRDGQNDQYDDGPDCEGYVTPDRVEGR